MNVQRLRGGRVNEVRRVGNVVHRRPAGPPPRFSAQALRFLATVGFDGAPRVVADHADDQVLTYLHGLVPHDRPLPAWAISDSALAGVARLVRRLHDVTAGTELAAEADVLCHHDLAPGNTVYRFAGDGGEPYAFIDWDLAGPGRRIEDIAHVCWQWLDLGPGITDIPAAARSTHVVLSAYGLEFNFVDDLATTVAWWQHRCWRGIHEQAANGSAPMQALLADGTAAKVRQAAEWTDDHLDQLTAAIRAAAQAH